MVDRWERETEGLRDPVRNAVDVTPSDSADLDVASRGIFVGGLGNLKVTMVGGQTVTFNNLPAGTWQPIRAKRVFATGTTATNIIAGW